MEINNRAYQLWEHTKVQESRTDAQEKIVLQLFEESKDEGDFRCKSIFKCFFKAWLNSKTKQALRAYKFDLFTTGKTKRHLNLFSLKEQWFIDQKISTIFKNLLTRKPCDAFEKKAIRWCDKVKKYHKNPEYLIGDSLCNQLKMASPKFKQALGYLEALPKDKIYRTAVKSIDDEEIINGLIKYLEKPFNKPKKPKEIAYSIMYYAALENLKWAARHQYKKAVSSLPSYPFITRAGLNRAIRGKSTAPAA